jgi:hypothetical protein
MAIEAVVCDDDPSKVWVIRSFHKTDTIAR